MVSVGSDLVAAKMIFTQDASWKTIGFFNSGLVPVRRDAVLDLALAISMDAVIVSRARRSASSKCMRNWRRFYDVRVLIFLG